MNNIIENNKIIAEFMGYRIIGKGLSHPIFGALGEKGLTLLNYNISWASLMPVVDKIENMDFVVIIKQSECVIVNNSGRKPKFIQEVEQAKIEAVYKAVVEFIKYYNNNGK